MDDASHHEDESVDRRFGLGTRRMGVVDRRIWTTSQHSSEDRLLVDSIGVGMILGIGTLALIFAR